MFLMFIPLILLLFWQTRSQSKKQEQAVAGLKKGDRVVTQSGLIGRLLELDARYAKLELAPGVKVQVLRSSLSGRDAEDSGKGDSGKADSGKADSSKADAAKTEDAKDKEKKDK
jgi:preprotein translocase subunit YajC